ncbi:MAG: Nramp family divalent metal transporter [Sulfolobales archaeon]|nr:Nramp family divalent metal transporter [Sulfolobales archaeon]
MPNDSEAKSSRSVIPPAPRSWLTALAFAGPGVVWAAEAIGSGELILSTRLGTAFGMMLLWVPTWAVILKNLGPGYLHGRWALTFGEGAMDMYAKIPPRRAWPIIFGILHILAGAMSIGALAASVGVVAYTLSGKAGPLEAFTGGMYILTLIIAIVGLYVLLEVIFMGMMASMVILTVVLAALAAPSISEILTGTFAIGFITRPADWATVRAPGVEPVAVDPLVTILPVLAWAAGGSASHIWYSYWVVGSKYMGLARYGEWGKPGDISKYKEFTPEDWGNMRWWIRTQIIDALLACVLTVFIIDAFFIAGYSILAPRQLLPGGVRLAEVIGEMYTAYLGPRALFFVLVGSLFILWSTNISQTVGWPIIVMDGLRYIYPKITEKISTSALRRIITVLMGAWALAWALGYARAPVELITWAAIFDGALLVSLQGILSIVAWIYIAPRELVKVAPKERVKEIIPRAPIIINLVCSILYIYFTAWWAGRTLGLIR